MTTLDGFFLFKYPILAKENENKKREEKEMSKVYYLLFN